MRLVTFLTLLALLAPIVGVGHAQTGRPPTAKQYSAAWQAAHDARDRGDCKAAVVLFTQAMRMADKLAFRRRVMATTFGPLFRGACYRRLGAYGKALKDLKDASRSDYLGSAEWVPHLEIGLVYVATGKRKAALASLNRSIRIQGEIFATKPTALENHGDEARRHVRVGEPYLRRCMLRARGRVSKAARRDCRKGIALYEARCRLVGKTKTVRPDCMTKTNAKPDVISARKILKREPGLK